MRNNVIQLNADQIDALRIRTAKWAYATRRIPVDIEDFRIKRRVQPRAGDHVLAKVKRIGQHNLKKDLEKRTNGTHHICH